MKKLATLLSLVAVAASVNAANIDWTVNGVNRVLTNKDNSTAANTTVYLIFADSTSLANITYDETNKPLTKDQFTSALSAITIDTVQSGNDGKKPASITKTVTSDKLTAGTSYAMAAIYVSEKDNEGFYRIVTATGKAYDSSIAGQVGTVQTSWSNMSSSEWTKAYAVPEPATGALALAGVALLFRRRRA